MIEQRDGIWYADPAIAAMICNVTNVTLINWRKMDNPPPFNEELKMYPIRELGEWTRKEQIYKPGRGGGYPHLPDLSRFPGKGVMPGTSASGRSAGTKDDAELRLKGLQGDKIEMELKTAAGELIPVESVRQAGMQMAIRIKTRLLRIPTALAPLVCGLTDVYAVQKHLEGGVREALEELSENWTEVAGDDEQTV